MEELQNEKLIDLHIHTIYSDGDHTPEEIVDEVKKSNVDTFSITDHDTLLGVKKLLANYNESNLKFIPGIEMTATVIEKGRLHILGYGFDPYSTTLNDMMFLLKFNAIQRVQAMIEYLYKYCTYNEKPIVFADEDLDELYNRVGNIGRPDIAKLCIKYGYASNVDEAFDNYLAEANEGIRTKNLRITDKEAIRLILKAGGIPVLAHPVTLERNSYELDQFVEQLVAYGLQGIEVYHYMHSAFYTQKLIDLAKKYNLLISGGSDYHGADKPNVKIGSGRNGNVKIKDLSILEKLKQR